MTGLLGMLGNAAAYASHLPWFLYDLSNRQLITSVPIPGDIQDTRRVLLTEVPIPGLGYQPVMPTGIGNRHISFEIPVINRNNTIGNMMLLQQFDLLRNQSAGYMSLMPRRFSTSPKVLYYWGVGSTPLEYWVARCDWVHKQGWTNQMGQPQYTTVSIELILDQEAPLYKMEEAARMVSTVVGPAQQGFTILRNVSGVGAQY